MEKLKVAIVHDWLVSQRGGENVLDAICELFPRSELFTLVYVPGQVSENILRPHRHVSALRHIPNAEKRYRHFLPLMPWAIERFDLSNFDLVLSSSHCVAKGVQKRTDAFHMTYIHAPMRYMWDRFDEYFSVGRYGPITRAAARAFRGYLQRWDRRSATRVDYFLANSRFIQSKVSEYYGRESQVVYPFCEPEKFSRPRNPGKNYLMVTALVPYKRVDLAIEAFNKTGKHLLIVGDGPDRGRLEKIAGPTIDFLGALKTDSLADMYSRCRALVFPGIEDFGIVPLEAMAAGSPVIAFAKGGALETVNSKTGVFFNDATEEGLIAALNDFESKTFLEADCRARARQFTRLRFQKEYIAALLKNAPEGLRPRIASSLEKLGSGLGSALASSSEDSRTRSPQP